MGLVKLWLGLLSLLSSVAGQTLSGLAFKAGDEVNFVWAFDGMTTGRYDFDLCAGDESTGNYETLDRVISDTLFSPGDRISFRVNPLVGGNVANAYFLKITPVKPNEHWSGFTSHFTMTNMQGAFSPSIIDAVKSMQPITIPSFILPVDDNLVDATPEVPLVDEPLSPSEAAHQITSTPNIVPTPTSPLEQDHNELRKRVVVNQHTVPWGLQTGLTKYAPMPKRAGSTIRPGSPTPQYPPFPFKIATTFLGQPTVQYTDNAYLTATAPFVENPAPHASAPTVDPGKQEWYEKLKAEFNF
ncbi:Uncharacterized protein PECH_006850 [Penicillium ucsense]|uniref:Yeast cell wall synthesis Kre9/Knh1 C-terminal domain-containing protein n=1 Tax=Penicillium ucsense TaxID=2839758 RepID=A0A8J8W9L7_9EURO|nr:Uncharacterized protein PECM_006283 [Penicillium ucsense]KAF7735260.1 Uncharacterized protein PECH_006850 [Penicillium ucsense]